MKRGNTSKKVGLFSLMEWDVIILIVVSHLLQFGI